MVEEWPHSTNLEPYGPLLSIGCLGGKGRTRYNCRDPSHIFPQAPVICGVRITLIKDSAFVFSNNGV